MDNTNYLHVLRILLLKTNLNYVLWKFVVVIVIVFESAERRVLAVSSVYNCVQKIYSAIYVCVLCPYVRGECCTS